MSTDTGLREMARANVAATAPPPAPGQLALVTTLLGPAAAQVAEKAQQQDGRTAAAKGAA